MQSRDEHNLIFILQLILQLTLQFPISTIHKHKDARASIVTTQHSAAKHSTEDEEQELKQKKKI